jgi:membrane protease YdiL (CAAX protease family)
MWSLDSIAIEPYRITRAIVSVCIVALLAAETTAVFLSIEASVACYAALFFVLVNLPVVLPSLTVEGRVALVSLALIPAVKIAAVVLPLQTVPEAYWEAFPAVIALITVVALRRVVDGSASELRAPGAQPRGGWALQVAIAAAGLVMAWCGAGFLWAFDLTSVKPGLTGTAPAVLAVAGLSGATLEIVFRGTIQQSLIRLFGPWGGIGLASASYAGLYAESGSLFLIVFALLTGLIWGITAWTTRALSGVVASHGLFAMAWAALY